MQELTTSVRHSLLVLLDHLIYNTIFHYTQSLFTLSVPITLNLKSSLLPVQQLNLSYPSRPE